VRFPKIKQVRAFVVRGGGADYQFLMMAPKAGKVVPMFSANCRAS